MVYPLPYCDFRCWLVGRCQKCRHSQSVFHITPWHTVIINTASKAAIGYIYCVFYHGRASNKFISCWKVWSGRLSTLSHSYPVTAVFWWIASQTTISNGCIQLIIPNTLYDKNKAKRNLTKTLYLLSDRRLLLKVWCP